MDTSSSSPKDTVGTFVVGTNSSPATTTTTNVASIELEKQWRENSGIIDAKERLLGEFTCSHQGDLLVSQGKLYLSNGYIVFHSSVLGQTTKKVVLRLDCVVGIEKSQVKSQGKGGFFSSDPSSFFFFLFRNLKSSFFRCLICPLYRLRMHSVLGLRLPVQMEMLGISPVL